MSLQIPAEAGTLQRDFLYGAAGSAVSLPLGFGTLKGSQKLLEWFGSSPSKGQTYMHMIEALSSIKSTLLRTVFKTFAIAYVILLIPILEEWFFRDFLYSHQEAQEEENSMRACACRVLSNALIFGAFHFSFFQGWGNIPIMVVTTVVGVVFAALREMTGSWRASSIAHAINNAAVLLFV